MSHNEKYYAFITSAGRTGTRFLGEKLGYAISSARSVHEPDVLSLNLKENFGKIREFGLDQMLWKRLKGKSGIRNLSQQFISGRMNEREVWKNVLEQRAEFWNGIDDELIIESYSGWYGLLPVVRQNLKNYKIVLISRHPVEWIRSAIQWESLYGKRDIVNLLGRERLNPTITGDVTNELDWKKFDQFEKLCWAWAATYRYALQGIESDSHAAVFKFEELFDSNRGQNTMKALLDHVSQYRDKTFSYDLSAIDLSSRVHENKGAKFPIYSNWSGSMKATLNKHCHEMMEFMGYNLEEIESP